MVDLKHRTRALMVLASAFIASNKGILDHALHAHLAGSNETFICYHIGGDYKSIWARMEAEDPPRFLYDLLMLGARDDVNSLCEQCIGAWRYTSIETPESDSVDALDAYYTACEGIQLTR